MLGIGDVVWGGRGVRVVIDMEVVVLELELDMDEEVEVEAAGETVWTEDVSKESKRVGVVLEVGTTSYGTAGVCEGYGHQ